MRFTTRPLVAALACAATLLAASACPLRAGAAACGRSSQAAGVLDLRPAIAQPAHGRRPRSGRPRRWRRSRARGPGWVVQLQRDSGSGWQTVALASSTGAARHLHPPRHHEPLPRRRPVARGAVVGVTETVRGRAFRTVFKDEFSGRRSTSRSGRTRRRWPGVMRMCSRLSPRARAVGDGTCRWRRPDRPLRLGLPAGASTAAGSHPYMLNTQLATVGEVRLHLRLRRGADEDHLDKGMQASSGCSRELVQPGDPAKGTEIDVVEFFGRTKKDSHIAAFVHWYDTAKRHHKLGSKVPYANPLKKRSETWSSSYHVFSVEWTADAYVFRVTGASSGARPRSSPGPRSTCAVHATSVRLGEAHPRNDASGARRWTRCGSGR